MEFYYTVSVTDLRTAYARFIPNVPLLLPASSWSQRQARFAVPKLPKHVTRTAADCGGFVATFRWGGVYRYSPRTYVNWLDQWHPNWAATMDFCCEQEVAANAGIVKLRQQYTSEMAYRFWRDYRNPGWTWVPTIQGWEVEDYRRHSRELRPLIEAMKHQPDFRVGIGTLCHRASVSMIHQVVNAVGEELPGIPLHLWGVKLGAIQSVAGLPKEVISVDSAAWNGMWGRDITKARNEREALGMSKAEFTWTVSLPRYRSKVQDALEMEHS